MRTTIQRIDFINHKKRNLLTKMEECETVSVGQIGRFVECKLREHRKGENDTTYFQYISGYFLKNKEKFLNPRKNLHLQSKMRCG